MKKTLTILWALLITVGIIFPNFYGSLFDTLRFGGTSFPTSLDSFTNPSATDTVATVSHSGQHSNVNDAIEAIEAKVGIYSSTPLSGSLLYSSTTGASEWSVSPSITTLTLSGLGTFGSVSSGGIGTFTGIMSTASSTFNAPFRFPSISQGGLYTGTGGLLGTFATTTAICSGIATCAAFTAIGSTPVDISVSAGASTFYVATSTETNAAYIIVGPISVIEGTQFLALGKGAVDENAGVMTLSVRPTNYVASTTLDLKTHSTDWEYGANLQAYWIATTTGNVYFDLILVNSNVSSSNWLSLIVQKL